MTTTTVRVTRIGWEAEDVLSFELRAVDGTALSPFTAGAHLTLRLTDKISRSYSLCNDPQERDRYVIAVGLDAQGRGGSRFMHEALRAGALVQVEAPRNQFPLDELAPHTVLIAGGIGITPLLGMAHRLEQLGRSWEIFYGARSRKYAAFVDAIEALASRSARQVRFHFEAEHGHPPAMDALLASLDPEASVYCCGPAPMLAAFEAAAPARFARDAVHVEHFKPKEAINPSGEFAVHLHRSGGTFMVPGDRSILDVLLDAGIDAPYSCMAGICGSCEVRVLEGVVDPRGEPSSNDAAEGRSMLICCSRAKSSRLVIDL